MSDHPSETDHAKKSPFPYIDMLEHGDGLAHVAVGTLLLLLALGILVNSTYSYIFHVRFGMDGGEFVKQSLGYLSDLLFGVIILELLSTILTYIHARNLEATIKDFLVVGLISSVRKILLTGAQSSLSGGSGEDYIKEAIGTVITVVGILLLIGGLLLLDRRKKANAVAGSEGEE